MLFGPTSNDPFGDRKAKIVENVSAQLVDTVVEAMSVEDAFELLLMKAKTDGTVPPTREWSLVITKLEEAQLWYWKDLQSRRTQS